jgi:hypothetical protein
MASESVAGVTPGGVMLMNEKFIRVGIRPRGKIRGGQKQFID